MFPRTVIGFASQNGELLALITDGSITSRSTRFEPVRPNEFASSTAFSCHLWWLAPRDIYGCAGAVDVVVGMVGRRYTFSAAGQIYHDAFDGEIGGTVEVAA